MFDSMIYPNSRNLHLRRSRTELNHAMPWRKRFPSSLLGSYWHLHAIHQFLDNSYRYPEMIVLHAENLASELVLSDSQDVQERLNKKLRPFVDGKMPHAADAISTLFDILSRPFSEAPAETNETNPLDKPKCTWAGGDNESVPGPRRKSMNIALIKSMHCGSFFDMEYRVRKRRTGTDQFASVYLSSTTLRGARSKLEARRSPLYRSPHIN